MKSLIIRLGLVAAALVATGCDTEDDGFEPTTHEVDESTPAEEPDSPAPERDEAPRSDSDEAPTLQVLLSGTNNEAIEGASLRISAVGLRNGASQEPVDGCGCTGEGCGTTTFTSDARVGLDQLADSHEVMTGTLDGAGHFDELVLFVEAVVTDGAGNEFTVGDCSEVAVVFPHGRDFDGGTDTVIMLDLDGEASLLDMGDSLAFQPTIVSYLAMTRWTEE